MAVKQWGLMIPRTMDAAQRANILVGYPLAFTPTVVHRIYEATGDRVKSKLKPFSVKADGFKKKLY